MDGHTASSSPSSPSSATMSEKDSSPKRDSSLCQSQEEDKPAEELWTTGEVSPTGDRLLSTEEQVTLITESMTVTSSDQEKLLLLNKNTELRRVNKELMKLNEDWDQVYRSATLSLQQRMATLELENTAIKELNSRLLLRVEHQQCAKEYYEQALMQELKKNQELQEYIRLLENRVYNPGKECRLDKQDVIQSPASCINSSPTGAANLSPSHASGYNPTSCFPSASCSPEAKQQEEAHNSSTQVDDLGDPRQEMLVLKEQLEVLRYQTRIYEAEYETEHNDHKHTLLENRRLRKKREEMRQQVALLQEQLKVYEDDFRRERSDKQMLQRLLLKKSPPSKELVLMHRCNNEQQPLGGDKRTKREETQQQQQQQQQHHPLCPKNQTRDKE